MDQELKALSHPSILHDLALLRATGVSLSAIAFSPLPNSSEALDDAADRESAETEAALAKARIFTNEMKEAAKMESKLEPLEDKIEVLQRDVEGLMKELRER
jgi:hypothetical protein